MAIMLRTPFLQSNLVSLTSKRCVNAGCRSVNMTVRCKLETTKKGRMPAKVVLPDKAPPLTGVESGGDGEGRERVKEDIGRGAARPGLVSKVVRKVLSVLSNLPLAIGEMFTIAALMALGTVIDQGGSP